MAFDGFSTDKLVGLPPELFTDIVPAITLASELKVTLHMFYRLSKQRGAPRRLSWDELAHDRSLRKGLRAVAALRPIEEVLAEGLEAAVRRTTILHVPSISDGRTIDWYLVNTAANRGWAEQMRLRTVALDPPSNPIDRPSVIAVYEQNIGLVTPMLVEDLREAEEQYPREWIDDAIREAVRANARSWRYVRKVLERWANHGRPNAQDHTERSIDIERYTNGQYGDLFRRGSDDSDL